MFAGALQCSYQVPPSRLCYPSVFQGDVGPRGPPGVPGREGPKVRESSVRFVNSVKSRTYFGMVGQAAFATLYSDPVHMTYSGGSGGRCPFPHWSERHWNSPVLAEVTVSLGKQRRAGLPWTTWGERRWGKRFCCCFSLFNQTEERCWGNYYSGGMVQPLPSNIPTKAREILRFIISHKAPELDRYQPPY